jgi:hypothetical protein
VTLPLHVSHIALDDTAPPATVCGEPWQSWQVPPSQHSEAVLVPEPRPHQDLILRCDACWRLCLGDGGNAG